MITAIIVAAGTGSRMGTNIKKQFIELNNKPIIAYTLEVFQNLPEIDEILIVTGHDCIDTVQKIVNTYKFSKVKNIVQGGKERQDSVYNGLLSLSDDTEIVLIHDGVRPFVNKEDILETINNVEIGTGAILGVKSKNTLKVVGEDGFIKQTLKRSEIFEIQTPQTFYKNDILKAYEQAKTENFTGTDDASLAERSGIKVRLIEGSYSNIKITTKDDILSAKLILEEKYENS